MDLEQGAQDCQLLATARLDGGDDGGQWVDGINMEVGRLASTIGGPTDVNAEQSWTNLAVKDRRALRLFDRNEIPL